MDGIRLIGLYLDLRCGAELQLNVAESFEMFDDRCLWCLPEIHPNKGINRMIDNFTAIVSTNFTYWKWIENDCMWSSANVVEQNTFIW